MHEVYINKNTIVRFICAAPHHTCVYVINHINLIWFHS